MLVSSPRLAREGCQAGPEDASRPVRSRGNTAMKRLEFGPTSGPTRRLSHLASFSLFLMLVSSQCHADITTLARKPKNPGVTAMAPRTWKANWVRSWRGCDSLGSRPRSTCPPGRSRSKHGGPWGELRGGTLGPEAEVRWVGRLPAAWAPKFETRQSTLYMRQSTLYL